MEKSWRIRNGFGVKALVGEIQLITFGGLMCGGGTQFGNNLCTWLSFMAPYVRVDRKKNK